MYVSYTYACRVYKTNILFSCSGVNLELCSHSITFRSYCCQHNGPSTKKYRIYLRKQRARRVGLSVVRFFAVYLQMCISYILSLGPMVLSTSNLLYWNGKLLTHKVTCLHLTSTITHALNFNVHECFHQNFSNMYSIILLYDLILS